MNLFPLGDRVIIEVDEKEQKVGSIILPDSVKDRMAQTRGTVVALGEISNMGLENWIEIGEKVIVNKYQGIKHEIDDVEYRILRADDVLAVERENG